jgi:hypothetical protein
MAGYSRIGSPAGIATDASLGTYGQFIRRITGLGQVTIAGSGVATNDIWTGAGIYPWLAAATSLEVLSASANDTAAGSGARTITITGLDTDYNEISVLVTLNGVTPVAVSRQFLRINLITVTSNGTSRRNEGQITVRDAGGGTVRALLPVGAISDQTPAMSKQSQYTVPAGHTLLIVDLDLQINSSAGGGGGTVKGADALLYFGAPNNGPVRMPRALTCTDNGSSKNLDPKTPIPVAEKFDFQMRASYTSAAGIILSGSWEGLLFRRND